MNAAIVTLSEYEELFGERSLVLFLKTFSCPLNPEVEAFAKDKSIQSNRLSVAVTYLVVDLDEKVLLGYFTVLSKPYSIRRDLLNSANRRLISRFSEFDSERETYTASVFLLAQIGKNYALDASRRISGCDLLELALSELRSVKKRIGGKLVLVEREMNRPKLLPFYQKNGFKSWTVRHSENDEIDYDQMIAVI